MTGERSVLRFRVSAHDAHYGGGLVDGARMLALFGDVATELCILRDGDEGLFRAYDKVEFLAPVYAGDFIEAEGEIVSEGSSSRKMRFVARKVIEPVKGHDSHCNVLPTPLVVCRASGTCVVPQGKQRGPQREVQELVAILHCRDIPRIVSELKELLGAVEVVAPVEGTAVVRVGSTWLGVQLDPQAAKDGGATEVVCQVEDIASVGARIRAVQPAARSWSREGWTHWSVRLTDGFLITVCGPSY